jgi:hypothetical protein
MRSLIKFVEQGTGAEQGHRAQFSFSGELMRFFSGFATLLEMHSVFEKKFSTISEKNHHNLFKLAVI